MEQARHKKKNIDTKVTQLLLQIGLSERAKHFPKELSGGQIQRAAIARALVNNPRLILADEPTGALDQENSVILMKYLRKMVDDDKKAVVIVTHDLSIARQCDRILKLSRGALSVCLPSEL